MAILQVLDAPARNILQVARTIALRQLIDQANIPSCHSAIYFPCNVIYFLLT